MKLKTSRGMFIITVFIIIRIINILIRNYNYSIFLVILMIYGLSFLYGGIAFLIGWGFRRIPLKSIRMPLVIIFSVVIFLGSISALVWTIILMTDESIVTHLVIPYFAFSYFYFYGLTKKRDIKLEYKEEIFESKDDNLFEDSNVDEEDFFEAYYKRQNK